MLHGLHGHRHMTSLGTSRKTSGQEKFSSGGSSTVLDGEASIQCCCCAEECRNCTRQEVDETVECDASTDWRSDRATCSAPAGGCLGSRARYLPIARETMFGLQAAPFMTRKCLRGCSKVCLSYLLEQSVTWIEPESDEDDFHSPKARRAFAEQGSEPQAQSTVGPPVI